MDTTSPGRLGRRRAWAIVLPCLLAAGCAGGARPVPEEDPQDREPILDMTQRTVHTLADDTARWFDGIFGSDRILAESEADVTSGRLSLGSQWDERDGLESRIRLKARWFLPQLERRVRLLVGRGDADDIVEGTGSEDIDTLPERFNDFDEEDWLFGIGYARDGKLRRGWDLGVGVKLATPVEQYARANYRWNKAFGESWLWRVKPQLFWKSDRGFGTSFANTLDYAVSRDWLLRSWSIAVVDEDTKGVDWDTKLTAYQRLANRSAFAYSVFASGETNADESLNDFGVEVRYRRPFLREWLFLEFLTHHRWPRESSLESRKGSVGFGIEIEMHFGNEPARD